METNKTDTFAQTLLYVQFPQYYIWNKSNKKWTKRKQGQSIGRIHHVPPNWGELFYLRMLLNKVKGATGWESFKEYDNVVYNTYKEACFARGLLDGDKEYINGIIEASEWGMGEYLRKHFVMLIMSEKLELSDTQRYNICLTYIEDALLSNSKSLKNIVNMPFPDSQFTMENYNRLIYDELKYNIPDLINKHKAFYGSLTLEQKGKTFLYKMLIAALRSKGKIVLNVASSGIAALLLDGGRTTHSRFAIPININEDSLCTITADSDLADLIRETKLIIWDEAPMVNKHCFEAFDRTLRYIATGTYNNFSDKVFGGKVIVFGGDFRQILPVIPNGTRQDVVHVSLNKYYLWSRCTVLKLTENMRLRVGGKNDGHAQVEFPEDMLIPDSDDHLETMIHETYENWQQNFWDPTETVYYSSDTVTDIDVDFNYNESLYSTEFLNSIRMSGIPNHKLALKIGAPIMCLRNINQRSGLCNGTSKPANKKVKGIRCDNGTEFKNAKLIELCGEKGIKRDYSNPRTPQQNGVAERKNRTLIEAARTMYTRYNINAGHLHHADWSLVLWNAMQIMQKSLLSFKDKNMKLRMQLHDMVIVFTQAQLRNIVKLKPNSKPTGFGNRDTAGIDSAGGVSAGSDSAGGNPAGSFPPAVSYEPAGQGNPAVSTSVSADFIPVHADESTLPPGQSLGSSENNTRFPVPSDVCKDQLSSGIFTSSSYDDDFSATLTNLAPAVEVNPVPTKRVNTIHPQSQILGDLASPVLTRSRAQKSKFGEKPTSIAKALEDPDWVAAMQEEMQQFINQKVWKLVPLPDGKNAIGTKWILKNKRDARGIVVRNKARLVAQGHRQEEGIDYDEMDVKSAFLYGEIEEEVYVTRLKAFEDPYLSPKACVQQEVLLTRHCSSDRFQDILLAWCKEFGGLRKENLNECYGSYEFLLSWKPTVTVDYAGSNEAEYVLLLAVFVPGTLDSETIAGLGFQLHEYQTLYDQPETICIVKNPSFIRGPRILRLGITLLEMQ
ncbi:ATP-dependent DNA helicase PIF1-like protein [Tanacetum coccineum]